MIKIAIVDENRLFRKSIETLLNSYDNNNRIVGGKICRISDVQEKEWPTVEIYQKKIESCSNELSAYISTHEDPFTLK